MGRSTGHIMVTLCHLIQQGSKQRQNPCQIKPPENIENLPALQFLLSGVLPLIQNLNYKLHYRLSKRAAHLPNKVFKIAFNCSTSYRTVTGGEIVRYFTRHCADQFQNNTSKVLTLLEEQPRSTRIVIAYPRPTFSAKKANKSRSNQS